MHYELRGRGRPVLLLHGFSSSHGGTWVSTGWVELLVARGFRTIGVDARGHGGSDKPQDPAAYRSERLVDDAVAVLADPAQIAAIADALEAEGDEAVRSPQARRLRDDAVAGGNDLRAGTPSWSPV